MSEIRKGLKVAFFNGLKPMTGVVSEIQEDGRIVVEVSSNGGSSLIVKDEEELRAFSDLQGRNAHVRFLTQ